MREGYVSLTLNPDQHPIIYPRKSWWRLWNQLSRLQRNLLTTLALSSLIFVIYLVDWKTTATAGLAKDESDSSNVAAATGPPPPTSSSSLPVVRLGRPQTDSLSRDSSRIKEVNEEKEEGRLADLAAAAQRGGSLIEAVTVSNRSSFVGKMKPKSGALRLSVRQEAVVGAFRHAWRGYKRFAWGHDHLRPISQRPQDWFRLGLTIVDSLDTMHLMGLTQELSEAREWVASELKLNEYKDVNLFEVTIRVLGGLLAAFHLTSDTLYREKARELGERLMPCFYRSNSAIPYSDVNLASHSAHSPRWGPDSSTSEVTTIQLEFRDLSRVTGLPKFEEAVSRTSAHVHRLPKTDGLVPVFINPRTGQFQNYADIKLGARGDSYYEYLLKQWLQTGKTIDYLHDDYVEAVKGIEKHLVKRTFKEKLLFIGELKGGSREFVPKMDHLVCYLPGTLALGYHHGLPASHLRLAEELLYTCWRTYTDRPTSLAPEITYFSLQDEGRGDLWVKSNDAHNLLRPEFVESLWYMYLVTGNSSYQDWGWLVFQAFEKYAKVKEGGYSSLGNVNSVEDTKPRDMMESFFLSETLKYFFLLFADSPADRIIDIDTFLLNTEGHPLPIYTS